MSGGLSASLGAFVLGLNGYSNRFDAHAQNTANSGVYSAKKHEVFLYSMVSQTMSTEFTPGGINSKPVAYNDVLGSVRPSVYSTFLALNSPGSYFIVNDSTDTTNPGQFSITRLGTFKRDSEGYLVNNAGKYLYGVYTDVSGDPTLSTISNFSQLVPINLANLSSAAVATTSIDYKANFPATASVGDTFTIEQTVYDSLGISRSILLSATRQANSSLYPNSQIWNFTVTSDDATGSSAISTPYSSGFEVVFDSAGNVELINGGTALSPMTVVWDDTSVATSTITLGLGTVGSSDGLTIGGSNFIRKNVTINGKPTGEPQTFSFDTNGFGWVNYNNGVQNNFCRIPVATVYNPDGLLEQTGGTYIQSEASGGYMIYYPNENNVGSMAPGCLEDSTVNTSQVFTDMIIDSNRYQACLKGIGAVQKLLDSLERINI
jgi:flagellar hook protein FlgE